MFLISVIIPTYKPGAYIYDCLDALLKQSLKQSLFEIILVLNGPREPYFSNIACYTKTSANIQLLYEAKAGVSNARNVGLQIAKSRYICFIDDDDIVSYNYLENLLQCSKGQDSIVVSNVYSFHGQKDECLKDYLTMKDDSCGLFRNRYYLSNACCKLIPMSIIGRKRFNTKISQGEDALFMFSISDKIKSIIKTAPDCIYYRRLRETSASRKQKTITSFVLTTLKLQFAFTNIYIKEPFKYNFWLYLSRILAVLKR